MNRALLHIIFFFALLGSLSGCSAHHPTGAKANRNDSPAGLSHAAPPASSIGFTSREKLAEHYHKHGSEFGNISIEDYLRVAQTLRDHMAGETIIEAVRTDGVTTRFDRETGTFIAFNRDGTIRTCFKPNDGEAYFRRQLKRTD
jgi:hypothetical protein